jgi:hypothetical protein
MKLNHPFQGIELRVEERGQWLDIHRSLTVAAPFQS